MIGYIDSIVECGADSGQSGLSGKALRAAIRLATRLPTLTADAPAAQSAIPRPLMMCIIDLINGFGRREIKN